MNTTIARRLLCACGLASLVLAAGTARAPAAPRNIVFILIDDMRYDAMSCMGHPFLQTPELDALAASGMMFNHAFVTTSLCSPSRACFLTGTYTHRHGVLNNKTRLDPALPTFPQELHKHGYKTAFIGKWHMGWSTDEPQPGFDYWSSFLGQGSYTKNRFNINGEHQVIEGYVTDVLTDMAVDWLKDNHESPFMLYLSHKAVHGNFDPAPRHETLYSDVKIELPPSSLDTPENYYRKPRWVREQRDSWHGINDVYFKRMTMDQIIRDYNRAMRAVDESVGRVRATLKALGKLDSTLIVFTSDNGFLLGEHGLIDKRCMYEESIRIPMLMSCPEMFPGGQTTDRIVLNIDVAPTFMEAAGLEKPEQMQGSSFLTLPTKPDQPWRESFLYEYFWEDSFPETPTVFGVRTERYKFVEYYGVWDTNELYDLKNDPQEMHNRISTSRRKKVTVDPEYQEVYQDLTKELARLKAEYGLRELPNWGK
jgi:N-acetylglucosamine-6-sulfatase